MTSQTLASAQTYSEALDLLDWHFVVNPWDSAQGVELIQGVATRFGKMFREVLAELHVDVDPYML